MDRPLSQLDYIINPKSVAVIGASNSFGSWGYGVMCRLMGNSHRKVYPINRHESEIMGIKAYSSILDVPGSVDFAVISIPHVHIPNAMEDCVQKRVKGALIISGGLAEVGEDGVKLEQQVRSIARKGGIRFIGPNSMGHIDTSSGFSTLAWVRNVTKGPIGFVSQSGTYGQRLVRYGLDVGLGFSKFISSGNEADVYLEDYLEYLGGDAETQLIIAYIEGLREGKRFFNLAKKITRNKPIVVLKTGRTAGAAKAARSHVAAMSGDDALYETMFKQCGVIRVDYDHEVADVVSALFGLPLPRGRRVGILTDGGGIGVVAADACEGSGLELAPFSSRTIDTLNGLLPSRWPRGNPVDMAAPDKLVTFECLWAIMEDENVDSVMLIGGLGAGTFLRESMLNPGSEEGLVDDILESMNEQEAKNIQITAEYVKKLGKPVVVSRLIPKIGMNPPVYNKLSQLGIPVYPSPEKAAKVLQHLAWYGAYLNNHTDEVCF
ncbi:MAG: CoA-binding protein [Thermodesulfobacteriota bacterium]|nr:CoA-binding protein [Thermodesulfobacteriota bacterium]